MKAPLAVPAPSAVDRVVSVGLWGLGLAWLVPMLGLLMALQTVIPADRLDWLARLYTQGQLRLTLARLRYDVHPDVRPDQPYLFVQNHVNHFDHCALYAATPHFKQGLELKDHFRYPVYGWFMRQRGTIPVDPKARGQLRLLRKQFADELARGHSLLAFPEGTRTTTGRVGPFHRGLLHVARDLGLPVVPVAVTGAYEVMRKGSWLIRPFREVTVHVEAPVPTAGLTNDELVTLAERLRETVAARVDAWAAARGLG